MHFNWSLFQCVGRLCFYTLNFLHAKLLTGMPRAQRSLADPGALHTTSLFFLSVRLGGDVPDTLALYHPTETKRFPKWQQPVGQRRVSPAEPCA